MTKPVGKEVVNVLYKWEHNHDDSGAARSRIPLGRNELTWTMKQAHSGMKWTSIRALLRPNKTSIRRQRLQALGGPTAPLYYMKYNHNYQHINTNNLVESWHKTLKRQHLGSQRNLRPDDLVHLLQGAVDVDFQQRLYQITDGFVDPPLSTYDASRKKKAPDLDFAAAGLMVKSLALELKFEVNSFANANASYSVCSNNDFTRIVSCTCADYCRHQIPCKHMYLVQRLHKRIKISYAGDLAFEPAADQEHYDQHVEFLGPDLEAGLSPFLRLQLDRKRAAEQEAQRVAREKLTKQEFEDYESELQELMRCMVTAVEARKKRKCTLEYLKAAVATTRNNLLEIQGLNAAQAGQKCQK
ncbi:hypothetical protein EDD21DRAFT_416467 [Dissophora ornata]|nr:hypothetical protein EDD21DRAFT_416467 [Dissophora ornata]